LNQQRARRFRNARDTQEKIRELRSEGKDIPDHLFDSNCITPGTAFMTRLSKHLEFFIIRKKIDDKVWQSIDVIFSGHEV
jgi:5'-3' exoribonuclease 1